jgi:exopolysaccharide biosynthesis WecB/TagA/CpsF family protein
MSGDPLGTISIALGPLNIQGGNAENLARDLSDPTRRGQGRRIAFANTHLLYCALTDPELANVLSEFDIFNDGVGIDLFARAAACHGFQDNLNGTDFTPLLLATLPAGARVFLLGGAPDVVSAVRARWSNVFEHLVFCGAVDGYAGLTSPRFSDVITAAKPDVIVVALGNPKQEKWIVRAFKAAPDALWIGVGALFDMVADIHPRAPAFLRRLHLEWLHRLAREPTRLWKRYTYEIVVIALFLARRRNAGRRHH